MQVHIALAMAGCCLEAAGFWLAVELCGGLRRVVHLHLLKVYLACSVVDLAS